jgi:hypothetical protein
MRGLVALLVLTLSACGLTMTTGPDPGRNSMERPRCTETYAAPMRDGVGAMVGLVAAVFGGVALEFDNETVGAPLLIGGLGVMLASYVSGGIGYFRVKRCKKAIAEFERRAPAPYAPPHPQPAQ